MNLQSRDDESRIPFGELIERIAMLEADLAALPQNNAGKKARLQAALRSAYQELQQKAMRKVNDWKKGPIIKERHIKISDLVL